MIETKQAERLKLALQEDDAIFTGAGAGGQNLKIIPSKGNRMKIGNHIVSDFMFSVMSLDHVKQALAQVGANEEILGVIGVDILKPGKAVIDYESMKFFLKHQNEL